MFFLRILLLLLVITATLTQHDFNVGDAVVPVPISQKPKEQPVNPKKPGSDDPKKPSSGDSGGFGFNLEDALKPGSTLEPKKPAIKSPSGGGGGHFDDKDLFDVSDGGYKPDGGRSGGRAVDPGYDNQGGADQPQAESSGPIAGIISAVGVALVGAASSYFAYQKKKLCFKMQGGADPESGKSHQGGRSDNQVFSNLVQNN
ncbi:CD99 molecule isoform X2 [Girardinichthys multiradiatus]|uniref:CD99 molecule isoform X2 n=1 Tax=Girardinichthys multiradiatus TaxID=208333 RepID=UPI001FAC1DD1|nr:CD99 molecule isoform X2 [Girardinichthys multiradiatus]